MSKRWKISLLVTLMMAMGEMSFAQSYVVDTLRLEKAEARLIELEEVDKGELSKAEKKAWRREKKLQKRIIAQEMDKVRFNHEMERQWRYGYGYGPYYYGGLGFPNPAFIRPYPYTVFYRRPVVVIRQQNCAVPNRVRSQSKN